MKHLLAFLLLFGTANLIAQSSFIIDGFSETLEGRIEIQEGFEKEVFKTGVLFLIDKSTQSELLKIESHEFTLDLEMGGPSQPDKKKISYQDQALIISKDFDFDGVKDFALMDGQNSCYHTASYRIYLMREDQLVYSPEFTRLTQEYCEFFQMDAATKTIHTSTKSGCCWREYSEFRVEKGIPIPSRMVTEVSDIPFFTRKTKTWKGGIESEVIEKTIDLYHNGLIEVFSFISEDYDKKLVLFYMPNRALRYVLIKKAGELEFDYPSKIIFQHPDFTLNSSKDKLSFSNGANSYQIYETRIDGKLSELGIKVKIGERQYDLIGDPLSLRGSLKNLGNFDLENVVFEE